MGTGISMSSVNKIKELAASGDYSLALDILEHQDLTRSLSPQFIKICGEVYYENGRYAEARAALVKAHSMAPIGNKIIYSLIKVYLSEGFYSLVDTYYEIYKFNQNEKDVGTYRIEYMIAKAKHSSIKELYGILISANEMETNAAWDFEMLLLYAAMKNMEKLRSESEIFCATYKGSPYIEKVNRLRDGSYDIENAIYCYPASEQKDASEEQEETRVFEQKVLEADHLRMFPKDPKITLMVEDREPVPNSVKFKQMLLKSKEKKELKKQQKKEQQEKAKSEEGQEKEKRFHIGRMSKKEEAAIEEVIAETEKAQPDKDKLLDEVMAVKEPSDSVQPEETEEEQKEQETSSVVNEEKNLDQISEESFDESLDDFDTSDITDDFDTVLMVDPDALEQSKPETEITAEKAVTEPEVEEAAEPETEEDIGEEVTEPETEEGAEKETKPVESENEAAAKNEVTEPETVVEEAGYAEPAEPHEYAETAETAEQLSEEDETVLIEESQIKEDEELSEDVPESEKKEDQKFDIDVAIQSLDEYKLDTDDWDDDSFEQAYEDDDIVEISEVPKDLMPDESDKDVIPSETEEPENPETKESEKSEIKEVELIESETVDEPETDIEPETEEPEQEEPEPTEPELLEQLADSEPEISEPVVENPADINSRKIDFPTFRSSLFPDYNSEKPPVVEHVQHEDIQKEYDQKMAENLKKEEALISETDELLARLGIELGTKYASNTDYFNMHQDSFVLNSSEEAAEADQSNDIKEADNVSDTELVKKSDFRHSDEKKYKLKKR